MAISRYLSNPKKKTPDGKTVYKSKRLKNIPLKNDDIYVATQTGDRLDLLSNQYYGSPTYWWIIANANNIHDGKLGLKDVLLLESQKTIMRL